MKRRSFLISACVIALVAVLAGCSDAVVYPEFPTGGFITQKGDFLEGQKLDSTKFEVTATYTNGATKTLTGVSIQDNGDGTATNGEDIWATVGIDAKGYDVIAEGQVTAYTVDHIEATLAGTTYPISASGEATIPESDITVTAYYRNAAGTMASMQLTRDEYAIGGVTPVKGSDVNAEEVPATVMISTADGFGGLKKSVTLDVTGTRTIEPEKVVKAITSVQINANAIAAFEYETLPEIDPADVVVNVKYADDSIGTLTDAQKAETEFSFVNQTTKLALRETEYDFTETTDIGIKAVYGDLAGYTEGAITLATPVVEAKYVGEALVIGADLPAIDPADFYVTLKINNEYEVLDLAADAFKYSEQTGFFKAYTGTTVPATLYVFVEYMGVPTEKGVTVTTKTVDPAIESVTFSVADTYNAPAKQYYYNGKYAAAIAITSASIEDFEVTMTKGEPGAEQAIDKFTFALYAEEGVALSEAEPVTAGGEYDVLADLDSVLVGAYLTADADKEDKVIYYSDPVALATPEIETLTAVQDPATAGMVGDPVKVAIVASNSNGDVDKDYKGYSIDLDGKPFTGSFSALTFGEEEVTYTVWMTSDPTIVVKDGVKIPAGQGYYELSGKPVLVLKEDAPEFTLVDANLIDSFDALYEIADDAFNTAGTVGEGKQAPAIKAYSVPSTREVVEGNNAITVTIEYYGKSGEVEKTTATVTIEGSSYVSDGATFTVTYNGEPIEKLESGKPYNVAYFDVVADAAHTYGTPEITITGIKTKYNIDVTGSFNADGNVAPYVISYEYVDDELKTVAGAALNLSVASN